MPPRAADITALLRALVAQEVEFVVVGGVCAVLHGAPVATFDLDIVPERTERNIERLTHALEALEAVHRDDVALSPRSHVVDLGEGLMVRVLDLDALIDTKMEAARPKDLAALPVLERTLEESRRRRE